jgi:hypothetical protein
VNHHLTASAVTTSTLIVEAASPGALVITTHLRLSDSRLRAAATASC